jgi:hypothetical protein
MAAKFRREHRSISIQFHSCLAENCWNFARLTKEYLSISHIAARERSVM